MVHWQCVLQMGCVLLFVLQAVSFFLDKAVLMPLASVVTSSGKTLRIVPMKNCSKIPHLSAMQRQQNLTLSYLQHSKFFLLRNKSSHRRTSCIKMTRLLGNRIVTLPSPSMPILPFYIFSKKEGLLSNNNNGNSKRSTCPG